jgi:bacillolysin
MKILTQKQTYAILNKLRNTLYFLSALAILNFCSHFSKAAPVLKISYGRPMSYLIAGSTYFDYCVSRGTNTAHGYINKVSMETINNQSGNNGGYGDFTYISANLIKGDTYTIELTPGFVRGAAYFEYWTVYIDYNHDGIFESNEIVATGHTAIRINKSFTIPAAALNGATRMRIQMQEGAAQTNPCATYTFGEVEDYTVILTGNALVTTTKAENSDIKNITEENEVNFMVYPNPAKDNLTLKFQAGTNDRIKVTVYNLIGQKLITRENPAVSGLNIINLNAGKLGKGIYIIEIENNGKREHQKFLISR